MVPNVARDGIDGDMKFCVRSELSEKAGLARLPYGTIHMVKTSFLDEISASRLTDAACNGASVIEVGDINTDGASDEFLRSLVTTGIDPLEALVTGIYETGVYGVGSEAQDRCRAAVERRVDFLCSMGAGFHNDTAWQWPSCMFWVLAPDVQDVEFVVPHVGFRARVARGDLIVFDPSLAHGLCKTSDSGLFVGEHFEGDSGDLVQAFLSGELLLDDAQWAALGCKWQPRSDAAFDGAVSLLSAEFDARSGRICRAEGLEQR